MAVTRTAYCWESQYDLYVLIKKDCRWQVARKVSSGTFPATSNVIWRSWDLAPNMTLSWGDVYALNWTADVPCSGASVTISGNWQECAKGAVYDLDAYGIWSPSSEPPLAGWMKVGKVNYKIPDVLGIHVVIGLKNAYTGCFETVFVEPTALPLGSSGTWQPQEQVIWWYQVTDMTGQVFSSTQGTVGGVDMTDPAPVTGKYEWWTTFTSTDGQWSNSQRAPSPMLTAPPQSEFAFEVETFPIARWVVFSLGIKVTMQAAVRSYIYKYLAANFAAVAVKFEQTNGNVLHIEYGASRSAQHGTREMIGTPCGKDGDPNQPITEALIATEVRGLFPDGEEWTIKSSPPEQRESAQEDTSPKA